MASAPTAFRFRRIGTQTKLSSCSRQFGALRGPMQQHRLAAGPRHDHRARGLDDAAGDAFADAVFDRSSRFLEAIRRLDAQFAAVVQQRDDAPDGAVMSRPGSRARYASPI